MSSDDRLAALALALRPGLGSRTLNRLWRGCQDRGMSLADATRVDAEVLQEEWDISASRAKTIADPRWSEAEAQLIRLDEAGAGIRWAGDAAYPPRLTDRLGDDAPFVLWGAGGWEIAHRSSVAISGTRSPSDAGAEAAAAWAGEVASRGLGLITGLARGVDQTATRAAMERGGEVIGVLAEGILSERAQSWIATAPGGGWLAVSEQATAPWNAGLAMRRNRLIAALADAVIIIEAAESGGTANQAQVARDLGVQLGVVDLPAPGNQALLRRRCVRLPQVATPEALAALLSSA